MSCRDAAVCESKRTEGRTDPVAASHPANPFTFKELRKTFLSYIKLSDPPDLEGLKL